MSLFIVTLLTMVARQTSAMRRPVAMLAKQHVTRAAELGTNPEEAATAGRESVGVE